MSFKKYIKAVGTGPKGNRDLEDFEIEDAINKILNKEATSSQIGAFLIAWRTKLETNNELKFMVKTLKKHIKFEKIENSLELGYSFDGRVNNPFLFPLYENILKSFFKKNSDIKPLKLVISKDLLQPSKNGLTTKEISEKIDKGQYIFFFDRVEYLNKLSSLTSLRQELGLRTAFNTVEKLLNPGLSDYAVTTAFHKPYIQKYIDIFEEYYKKIVIVKASEGSPEVFKDGKYWEKIENKIVEKSFKLSDYGINYNKKYEKITLEESLNIINSGDEEILKLAKFNISLYLVFANRVHSLNEAWERLN